MADLADLTRIETNLKKMIDQRATTREMDKYLASEGYTPESFKLAMSNARRGSRYIEEPTSYRYPRIVAERFTEPFVETGRAIARGLIGPDPYLQPKITEAQRMEQMRQPPPLTPRGIGEKTAAGVGSGLGGVGATMGLGGLARAVGLAPLAETLMAYPGMQTVAGVTGGVAGEVTGSPLVGLLIGLAVPFGGGIGKGIWARLFDHDKPFDKAHELFLKDYIKRLEAQGRNIDDIRAKILAAPEGTPLAAIDSVAEQLLRESLNRPEVKRALKGFGPTAAAERFVEQTIGNIADPTKIMDRIKGAMTKTLGAPADVSRAERVLDALISRQNQRARKEFLWKELTKERLSDLNDQLANNPRYQEAYDRFMDTLRDAPDYAPALPNDNRRAREVLARYDKILKSGRKNADKAAEKFLKESGYTSEADLLEERHGTAGLTEDLFDSWTRFLRDPAHDAFEKNTIRNAVNRAVGSMDIKFVEVMEKLRDPKAEPWKQELNRLYTLKNALTEGKALSEGMLKGQITGPQARDALSKFTTPESKEFFRRGFLDRFNLSIEDDPLSALRNLPRSPNDQQVMSEIFSPQKAQSFYKSIPGLETQSFAERTKGALRREQEPYPTTGETMKDLGVQAFQAMRKYIGPLAESITAIIKDRPATYYPRVRELIGGEALQTDKAAQQQFMDQLEQQQRKMDAWKDTNLFSRLSQSILTGGGATAPELGPYLAGGEAGYRPFRQGGPLGVPNLQLFPPDQKPDLKPDQKTEEKP
jgi:hypothetical protein